MKNIPWYAADSTGRIDNLVYYRRNGKTFTRKHVTGYNKTATDKQAAVRERFLAAHLFAKGVIADPALKTRYTQMAMGKCSAYAKAVSEFMKRVRET